MHEQQQEQEQNFAISMGWQSRLLHAFGMSLSAYLHQGPEGGSCQSRAARAAGRFRSQLALSLVASASRMPIQYHELLHQGFANGARKLFCWARWKLDQHDSLPAGESVPSLIGIRVAYHFHGV